MIFSPDRVAQFVGSRPATLVVDLRGTVLAPYQDVSAHPLLLSIFSELLHRGTNIAFVSGCSRSTVTELILKPWGAVHQCFQTFHPTIQKGRLFAYTATGGEGYSIERDFSWKPLSNYAAASFEPAVALKIYAVLSAFDVQNGLEAVIEKREAQFNFYVQADRSQRLIFKKRIKAALKEAGIEGVCVHVPSSKRVVDIAMVSKRRAIQDLATRLHLYGSETLFVSDSLQSDGPDAEMLDVLPRAKAIHVGADDFELRSTTLHVDGGPQATQKVLSLTLSLPE